MEHLLADSGFVILAIVFLISLVVLVKAADFMVDNAVILAQIWGLPEMIIGATVISLGTSMPELASSVISALSGSGGYALGNAVGSVITNNSLILGLGALFCSIPVVGEAARKFTLLVISVSGLLLAIIVSKLSSGVGFLPSWLGFVFLMALPVYLFVLVRQEKDTPAWYGEEEKKPIESKNVKKEGNLLVLTKIIFALLIIAISASTLVSSVEISAARIGISDLIIASTIVAFGTSIPEISTMLAAAKKRRGGLAVGNILGANVLNILLVLGASLAVSKEGILVAPDFFSIHIPALVVVIMVFGYFVYNRKIHEISRPEGLGLILIYAFYLLSNILGIFANK